MSAYKFIQNSDCEFFPCHQGVAPEDFNCLFCYCPLYAMGTECGGDYHLTPEGIKDCSPCNRPHQRDAYDEIAKRSCEIVEKIRLTCCEKAIQKEDH